MRRGQAVATTNLSLMLQPIARLAVAPQSERTSTFGVDPNTRSRWRQERETQDNLRRWRRERSEMG